MINNNLKNFNWEKYINYYEDLKDVLKNKKDAINHWIKHGKYENRIYFDYNYNIEYENFNWVKYINYYDDLKNVFKNKEDAINHWLNYGKKENRIYFKNNLNNDIKFYIINLDSRKDRYSNVVEECKKINIENFERFSAIKPTYDDIINCSFININKLWKENIKYIIGSSGCKMSHYQVLKKALLENKNYEYICILEDDVVFEENTKKYLINALDYIKVNAIDIDILFFSSNLSCKSDAEKISNNLLKLNKCLQTTAQIFKYSKLEKIINIIENSDAEIDNTYQDYLSNKYCIYPMCVYQKQDHSDIINDYVNYEDLHKKFTY